MSQTDYCDRGSELSGLVYLPIPINNKYKILNGMHWIEPIIFY